MNHINAFILQELVIIGVIFCARYAVFFGGFLCALLDEIAERDHFAIFHFLQGGHMLAVGNSAAADNSYFDDLFHHIFPFNLKIHPAQCRFLFRNIPATAAISRANTGSIPSLSKEERQPALDPL